MHFSVILPINAVRNENYPCCNQILDCCLNVKYTEKDVTLQGWCWCLICSQYHMLLILSWIGEPQLPLAVTVDNTGETFHRSLVFYCTTKAWNECACKPGMHMCKTHAQKTHTSYGCSSKISPPPSGPSSLRSMKLCVMFAQPKRTIKQMILKSGRVLQSHGDIAEPGRECWWKHKIVHRWIFHWGWEISLISNLPFLSGCVQTAPDRLRLRSGSDDWYRAFYILCPCLSVLFGVILRIF